MTWNYIGYHCSYRTPKLVKHGVVLKKERLEKEVEILQKAIERAEYRKELLRAEMMTKELLEVQNKLGLLIA